MATFLFWFQMVMAFAYSIPLITNIINGKTEGLTLATYAIFLVYTGLSLSLAMASYRHSRSKIRLQTIIIFVNWIVLIGLILTLGFFVIPWRRADSAFSVAILVVAVLTAGKYKGLQDPIGRGWMAVWCKALPQLWLAYTMMFISHGACGFALTSLVAGHLTSMPRLWQVYLSGKKDGWDRPTRGLILGESANVITWWVVTAVWVYLMC